MTAGVQDAIIVHSAFVGEYIKLIYILASPFFLGDIPSLTRKDRGCFQEDKKE